jgi:hypothetical protein
VFFTLQKISTEIFYPILLPWVKDQEDEKLRNARATKSAKYVFQVFYFAWATWYGYETLKDSPCLPPALGGKGLIENGLIDVPFVPVTDGLVTYIMLQLGYHGGDLFHHIFFKER